MNIWNKNIFKIKLILELTNDFKNNSNVNFYFKELNYDDSILIKTKFNRLTDENPFPYDIYFYVKIDNEYPESIPYVTCNTSVN